MGLSCGLCGKGEFASPTVFADDDVFPVHLFDAMVMNRKSLYCLQLYNDQLDAEKLHSALLKLLEIGDWRVLGGRLRLKKDNSLELHVPKKYTAERPAVLYHHEDLSQMRVSEHPTACHLPKPSNTVLSHSLSPEVRESLTKCFASHPVYDMSYKTLCENDIPQLSVRITTFLDASIVTIAWCHTLLDAYGQTTLLKAWAAVVAGREDQVPASLGWRNDILTDIDDRRVAEGKTRSFILDSQQMSKTGQLRFLCKLLWNKWRHGQSEVRMVCIPKDALAQIRREVEDDARRVAQIHGQDPFVSENDVLMAWFAQRVVQADPKSRPLTILSILNARFRLPELMKEGSVYLQNMVLATWGLLSPRQSRSSVGALALANRSMMLEQTKEDQFLNLLHRARTDIEKNGKLQVLHGSPKAVPLVFNNLSKFQPIRTGDFSLALVKQGESSSTRVNPLGTMSLVCSGSFIPNESSLSTVWMFGRDYGNNYWLMAGVSKRTWVGIEKEFSKLGVSSESLSEKGNRAMSEKVDKEMYVGMKALA